MKSVLLFQKICIHVLLQEYIWIIKSQKTDGGIQLDLRFADDVALTTEVVKDMEHQLNTVNEESLKTGLRIQKEKPV